MITFICLLFPSAFSMYSLLKKENLLKNKIILLEKLIIYNVFTNLVMFLIVSLKYDIPIIANDNFFTLSFAFKYLLLASIIAYILPMLVPLIINMIKENIKIDIEAKRKNADSKKHN